jgi:hypothetical protein
MEEQLYAIIGKLYVQATQMGELIQKQEKQVKELSGLNASQKLAIEQLHKDLGTKSEQPTDK